MRNQKIRLIRLQLPTGLVIVLGLALILAGSQVRAAHPSGNSNLITPTDKESLELYPPYGSYIHINPPVPTPNDVIRITVSGEWPNGCVPTYQSHQLVGQMILIDATARGWACPAIVMPWAFTVEVGPLPVSLYTIEIYITLRPLGGPILYDTTSFIVSRERIYLPLILRR